MKVDSDSKIITYQDTKVITCKTCAFLSILRLSFLYDNDTYTARFHLTFQTINFTEPFYAPPVVFVTPKHSDNNNNSGPRCNAVTAWVEVRNTRELGLVGYGTGEDLTSYTFCLVCGKGWLFRYCLFVCLLFFLCLFLQTLNPSKGITCLRISQSESAITTTGTRHIIQFCNILFELAFSLF